MDKICECGHHECDHFYSVCSYDCYCDGFKERKLSKICDIKDGYFVRTINGDSGIVERIRKGRAICKSHKGDSFIIRDNEFCIISQSAYKRIENFKFIFEELIIANYYAEDILENDVDLKFCNLRASFVGKESNFIIELYLHDDDKYKLLQAAMNRFGCSKLFMKILNQAREEGFNMIKLFSINKGEIK